MKIILTQGLPASGKSTWAKAYVEKNRDWVRVNRDDLRNMRGHYWIPKQEKLITKWEDSAVSIALAAGYNVILDSTNMNNERNKSRLQKYQLHDHDLGWETKRFDTSVKECIKRDLARANSVGEKVIRDMYNRYNPTEKIEDTQDTTLTPCIIVDIDGTLADMGDRRGPYDWDNVGLDDPRFAEINWLRTLSNAQWSHADIPPVSKHTDIILFSGRDGVCREETKVWLKKHNVPYDMLRMRSEGDQRKDSIVKREMFDQHIKDKYWCWCVIDDRNQVVDMWRSMGLTCFQVQPGDF